MEKKNPYIEGKNYIFRMVTLIAIGRVKYVTDQEIVLDDACWVADAGRWHRALLDPSELQEVEPCPDGEWIIGRGAVVDAGPWRHDLPRDAK